MVIINNTSKKNTKYSLILGRYFTNNIYNIFSQCKLQNNDIGRGGSVLRYRTVLLVYFWIMQHIMEVN